MNPDLEKAIAAIRSQGGTDADVEAYVRSLGGVEARPAGPSERERMARARAREATNEAERTSRSRLDEVGAVAESFADASTFGLAGLATDAIDAALSGRTFRANRDARQMSREAMSGYDRTLSGVAGALANPVGAVFRPAQAGTGIVKAGLLGAREGAVQGAMTAFGENAGTTRGAADATVRGAVGGALLGGAVPAAVRLAERADVARRIFSSPSLGKTAQQMEARRRVVDDAMYEEVRREAGQTGTTPAIQEVLQSQTVKPFADMVRREEATAGLNDAETLIEAYKLMSRAQRKASNSTEGTAEYLAELELRGRSIGRAKGRMLDAAETGTSIPLQADVPATMEIPPGLLSLRPAVREAAQSAAATDAFEHTANAIRDVLYAKSVNGKKLRLETPEALTAAIKQMTPDEAEAALSAVMGRAREVVRLSSNPIGDYGLRPSLFHAVRAPSQVEPFVRLLEEQALRRSPVPTFGDRVREMTPGLLGRTQGNRQ